MFGDFITLGCDQIINQASKIQNMYGVRIDLPLVLRVPMGGYRGYGPTHSQSLESLFINTCQLKILSPNIFSDPGLMLIKAVDDKKLTLFIEHKANYSKDLLDSKFNDYDLNVEVLNDGDIFSPIICGLKICKTQPVDAFIFTYGFQANLAIEAIIKSFMEDEYHVKLIVYSDILDLKLNDLHEKCSPVGKFLILQEAQIESGWANYACSQIQKKFFNHLKAPVLQVGAQHPPIPSAIELEASHLPSVNSIYDELRILIEHNYKS
jgi:pyruvate/2-oxoglutarate/acetoin dehydrogenase E1 component